MTSSSPASPVHLLTVEELADFLRVSVSTVYRLVERRDLPFYRFPGSLRFSLADVQAFLKGVRVEPMKPQETL